MPDFPIDPTTTSGTELANILNRLFQNITINWFASQAEVDAGTINDKYIAPDKLKGRSTATGGTAADSGKYPQLDAAGKIPLGMLPAQVTGAFKPQGTFDPTAGPEYPAPTGLTAGWIYILDKAHTFAGGNLATLSLPKGDMIYWGADNQWHAAGAQIDDSVLVKTDGSNPMLQDFNFGSKKGLNLADATAGTDALNKQTGETLFVEVAGDTMTGDLDLDTHLLKFGTDADLKYAANKLQIRSDETDFSGTVKSDGKVLIPAVEKLNLNVDGGGSATPADPLGGDAFLLLSQAMKWAHENISFGELTVTLNTGTYNETGEIKIYGSSLTLKTTGAVTINFRGTSAIIANIITGSLNISGDFTFDSDHALFIDVRHLFVTKALTINTNISSSTLIVVNGICSITADLTIKNSTAGTYLLLETGAVGYFQVGLNTTVTFDSTSAGDVAAKFSNSILLAVAGTLDTPGTAKKINTTGVYYIYQPTTFTNNSVFFNENISHTNPGFKKDSATRTLTCFGKVSGTGSGLSTVTLPVGTAYKNTDYYITCTWSSISKLINNEIIVTTAKTTGSFQISAAGLDPAATYEIDWMAIGEY